MLSIFKEHFWRHVWGRWSEVRTGTIIEGPAMTQCPRCLKTTDLEDGSIHTCTPTEFARTLEARVEGMNTFLKNLANETSSDGAMADAAIHAAILRRFPYLEMYLLGKTER